MAPARVLIVEDSEPLAIVLRIALARLGHEVADWVASGEEAVERARASRPDIVLMDIHLAGEMDGVQAARTIWSELHVPVVFLTSDTEQLTIGRAKLAEPQGFLVKPVRDDELRVAIEIAVHNATLTAMRLDALESIVAGFDTPRGRL